MKCAQVFNLYYFLYYWQMPQILFPLNKVEAEVKKQIVSVKYTCTCGQVISPVLENGSTDIEEKSRKAI